MIRWFRSFFFGLLLPWSATKLIFKKKVLLFWSILPFGITLIFYIWMIRFFQNWATESFKMLFLNIGFDSQGWLFWFISILFQLLLWLLSAITFTFTSAIIASPFNDFLAEKTERTLAPPLSPPLSSPPTQGWKTTVHLIWIDLFKTCATFLFVLLAFLFAWIPILNIITFVLALLFITFQYLSYPQTRRGQNLKESLFFLKKHFFSSLGFGISLSFLFAIPFLSSFTLPIAVVGGTILYARAQPHKDFFLLK